MPATTDDLRAECFRLRYKVYCVENPYEDPAENPHDQETDEFDSHSVHNLLIHRPSGMVAGAVRLVLPRPDAPAESFPVQRICSEPQMRDPQRFPVAKMAEMSRFCISKEFRRRRGDGRYPTDANSGARPPGMSRQEERRVIPHMTIGLMQALVRMSAENGVTYLCATMERQLLRLLTRMGIYFDPIGPTVEYHGTRQPCFRHLGTLLEQVRRERKDVWEIMTDEGTLAVALRALED